MNAFVGSPIRLFALAASRALGEAIARHCGVPLCDHEEKSFEDGEHKSRPLVDVRGTDAFVVQSLYGDDKESVHDKFCRLLFFVAALKDAGARVTAVAPYLCYARKDRRSNERDGVTSRYVAQLLEAAGIDCVVTMDVHNPAAFDNAFRCSTLHLQARDLFAAHFAAQDRQEAFVVVSPDSGGMKRAEEFRRTFAGRLGRPVAGALMEKHRQDDVVSGAAFIGDVDGKIAVIVDDLISTGTTLSRAANACVERGAKDVYAVVTHGLFTGDADRVLGDSPITKLCVTNTVPPFRLSKGVLKRKVEVLDATALFADAIVRLHAGPSATARG